MKYYSVDRIEGSIAVLTDDDGKITNTDISLLPAPLKEGAVLKFDGEKFIRDSVEEEKRRNEIKSLHNKLFKKKKDG